MNPLFIPVLGDLFGKALDRLFPDPDKKAEAQLELIKMQQAGEFKELDAAVQLANAQADINKAEASSGNVYAAGWRPTMGYILAVGLAYQYIARPLLIGIGGYASLPPLDSSLFELVAAMLGMAGLRTYEKAKGIAK